jgi:hypothetical protein
MPRVPSSLTGSILELVETQHNAWGKMLGNGNTDRKCKMEPSENVMFNDIALGKKKEYNEKMNFTSKTFGGQVVHCSPKDLRVVARKFLPP